MNKRVIGWRLERATGAMTSCTSTVKTGPTQTSKESKPSRERTVSLLRRGLRQ